MRLRILADRLTPAMALLAVVLGGCSGLTYKEPPPPDPNLYPSDYRVMVTMFLRTYLGNPRNLRDASISEPKLQPIAGASRYVSCVRYNEMGAENRYVGIVEKMAIFVEGHINQFLDATREQCGAAVYQRFPEAEAKIP